MATSVNALMSGKPLTLGNVESELSWARAELRAMLDKREKGEFVAPTGVRIARQRAHDLRLVRSVLKIINGQGED